MGLTIHYNAALTNLSGLDNLTSIGTDGLVIDFNESLTSVAGLSNLSSVGGGLLFLNNPALADYCGLQRLLFVGFTGTYSAVGNATNPTMEEISAMFCD